MTDNDTSDPRPRPTSPPKTPLSDMPLDGPLPPSRPDMPPAPPASAQTPPSSTPKSPLSRRKFIGAAGGVAGAAILGGGALAALVRESVETSGALVPTTTVALPTTTLASGFGGPANQRILVVLEMAGGNDALNTLVSSDGRYRSSRPQLAIAENELVTLAGTDFGLHPSLAPLAPYWDAGTMAAIAGSGMDDQSRSHFKAMDTWWSGVPGAYSQTGWLGRWLDATLEGENDPLRAIAFGGGSRALLGKDTLATVMRSPANFTLRTMDGSDNDALVAAFLATAGPLSASNELAAAQYAIPSTISAVDILASVSGSDDNDALPAGPNNGNTAASLLQTAAGIIDLGIGTRVITVGISGFDTHANQADPHANLLADIGNGLAAFFERLEADGHGDNVMVMTTSEFGRRVVENGSGGTDHGSGGCQFLFGPDVSGGQVVGDYDLDNLRQGDIPIVVDTRSVYAAALDWMGGPTDEILGGAHDRLGLLSA